MGWMGGGQESSQSQKWEPPDWTIPGWQGLVQGAAQYAGKEYQPFDGMQVAPLGGYDTQWADFLEQRALEGAPDLNAGRGAAMKIASGQMMNPYGSDQFTQQIINNNANAMAKAYSIGGAAQNDAMAQAGGGWGGGGWLAEKQRGEDALAQQIGQMSTNVQQDQQRYRGQLYDQDRAAMLQAGGLAGQLSQDDWMAGQQLGSIGKLYRDYTQGLLGTQYGNWQQAQQYPMQMLDVLRTALGSASGVGGSSFSQMAGGQPNPWLGALGAGAIGYSMF